MENTLPKEDQHDETMSDDQSHLAELYRMVDFLKRVDPSPIYSINLFKGEINKLKEKIQKKQNHIIYKIDNVPYTDYTSNLELSNLYRTFDFLKRIDPSPIDRICTITDQIDKLKEKLQNQNNDTVYFHLEKITSANKDFWSIIVKSFANFPRSLKSVKNGQIVYNQETSLDSGFEYFKRSIEHIHGPLSDSDNFKHNVYIAYTSPKQEIELMNDIEYLFTVIVHPDYVISTHMGIFKNPFYYLDDNAWSNHYFNGPPDPQEALALGYINFRRRLDLNGITNEEMLLFHSHTNLSVKLHIFAGYIIQKIYPNIKGMITSPTSLMLKILQKALGDHQYGLEYKDLINKKRKIDKTIDGLIFFDNKYVKDINIDNINPDQILAKLTRENLDIGGIKYDLPPWECEQLQRIDRYDRSRCYTTETSNQSIFIPYETFKELFGILQFNPV